MQQQELHESGITSPEEVPGPQEQIQAAVGRSSSPRGTPNSGTNPARHRIRVSNLLGSSVENFGCSKERRSGNGCSKLLGIRSKQSNGLSSPAPYLLPKAGGAWKNRRKNESVCAKAADFNILDNPGSWPALASTSNSDAGNVTAVPETTEKMGLAQAKTAVTEEGAGCQGASVSSLSEAPSASPTAGGSGDWASVVRQHSSSPADDGCGTLETSAKSVPHSESSSESLHCKGPCRSSVLRPLLCNTGTAVTGSRSFSEILGSGSGDLCRRAPSNTAVGTERGRTPRSADDVWRREPGARASFQEPSDSDRSPFDVFRAFRGDFGSSSTPAYPRRPVNLTRMQSPARYADACYEENLDVKDGVKKSYEADKMSDTVAETLKDFYTSGMEVQSDNMKSGMQLGKSLTESPKKKSLLEKEAGECALAMMSASKTLSEIIQENLRSKERDGGRMIEEKSFVGHQSELRESYFSESQYNLISDSDIQKRFFLPHLGFCEDTCPKKVTDGKNFSTTESQCCLGIGQHPIRILSRASAPNSLASEEKHAGSSAVHQKQTCPGECLKCASDVDQFLRESLMRSKSCRAEECLVESNTENPFCMPECKNLDLENKQITLASRYTEQCSFEGQAQFQTVKLDDLSVAISKSKTGNESTGMKEGIIEMELDSIAHERAVHEQGHLAKAERNSERCEQLVEGSSTVPYGICGSLEVTIPEDNDATVAIEERKTESPKSHLEVTIYARHQAKGEKGLLQTVPGKVEDAKITGRNPLPAPRFTRDTKLKKQGTTGKKANVKAAQDMTAKSKTSSLVKTACSEGDNLPGYLQQLHISVLSDGSKQVSRSAEHSSTSSEDREVSVKSTDSSYSCGGTENNSRNAQDESTEKNNQHVTHGTCQVTKKQEQSSKKTTGATAGSATALVHSGLAPKPTETKFRPDCRAGAFVSTYQRGRRKLPVISTKYRYVASQRTTRTDPTYRHQHQGTGVNASASTSQKAATGSPVSGVGNRMQSPACSDSFSGMASKSGGGTAGTQVLLKSPGTTASKSISSSSQLTVHKSVEQGARSPYKKDNTQYPIDSPAVDVSAGRKKTTLRKTTLIRHPRNRAQMPMVRSAQYTNSSFEEDPKMCYTLGDGRKIVFSPNAVNTPLNKVKKVHEEKSKAASGGSNTPSNDTEEGPSEVGKEAVRCNSATEANKATVKENKAQNETCTFDTPDKYAQETAQQSPQKSTTVAAATQCSIPNGRGATKHRQDSSELHAMEEMLLAPTSALPVATNNFQASYGGPAAKPRLYREQHQHQQQQQGQQQQQQQQQQEQQQQQPQPQQFPYGAETYPDHYHQSFPDGRLSLFDPVPNRCAVQSSNSAGIRQGHYVRDMLSRIDDVQQHTQHFSSNQDIRTNRTVFDASVNLLAEASVLGGCATSVRTAAVAVSSREQYHLLRCEGCSATVPVLLPSAPEEILTCSAIPTHAEPPLQLFTSSVGLVPIREMPVTYPLSNAPVQQPFLMDLQQFVQLNDQPHNMVTLERISTNDMPVSEPAQRTVPIDRNSARFGDTWTPFGHPPLPWHDWSQYSSSLQPSDFAMPEAAPGIIVEPQQPPCNREQNSSSLHTSTDGLQLQEGNNNVNTAFYPPSRRSVSTPSGHYSSGAELHPNKNIACVNVEGQYYS